MKNIKNMYLFFMVIIFSLSSNQTDASYSFLKKPIIAAAAVGSAVMANYQHHKLTSPKLETSEVEKAFKNSKLSADFNIHLVSHYYAHLTKEEALAFVKKTNELAHNNKDLKEVQMYHVDLALACVKSDRLSKLMLGKWFDGRSEKCLESYLISLQNKNKKEHELNPDMKKYNAYHESSHALMGVLKPVSHQIISQLSLIPQGVSNGVVMQFLKSNLPINTSDENSSYTHTQKILNTRSSIMICLAGGIGEQILRGEKLSFQELLISPNYKGIGNITLVGSDIHQAFSDAIFHVKYHNYTCVSIFQDELEPHQVPDIENITKEVMMLLEECYEEAYAILSENKDLLDAVARSTLDKGVISGDEIYALAGVTRPKYEFEMTEVEKIKKITIDSIDWTLKRMAFYERNHPQV